jgi:hypothetical protein
VARPEWTRLCAGDGLSLDGDAIEVKLSGERRHSVSVRDAGTVYELQSVVVRPGVVRQLGDVPLRAWRRNRSSQLVGLKVDQRGRLVGEAWVPKAGLSAEEFQSYVRRVAAECDRFEYLLTGADSE